MRWWITEHACWTSDWTPITLIRPIISWTILTCNSFSNWRTMVPLFPIMIRPKISLSHSTGTTLLASSHIWIFAEAASTWDLTPSTTIWFSSTRTLTWNSRRYWLTFFPPAPMNRPRCCGARGKVTEVRDERSSVNWEHALFTFSSVPRTIAINCSLSIVMRVWVVCWTRCNSFAWSFSKRGSPNSGSFIDRFSRSYCLSFASI